MPRQTTSRETARGLLAGIWGYIIGTAVGIATANGLAAWLGAGK